MKKIYVLIFLGLLSYSAMAQEKTNISIIPRPVELKFGNENFLLSKDTKIIAPLELKNEAEYIAGVLKVPTGFGLEILQSVNNNKNILELKLDSKLTKKYNKEAYTLLVTKNRVTVSGGSAEGIFYGLQTLLQILPIEIYSRCKLDDISWTIPGVNILDYPRFGWRGFMLDASRSFQSLDYVKKTLDLMAMHKMNLFHWHLTDDHGWRVEIKKYPWLTEVGGYRNQPNYPEKGKLSRYGGYYTQEEIREIIKYAQDRHITILPEVEFPGHAAAIVHAMPEIACVNADKPDEVRYFKDFPMREKKYIRHKGTNVICAGKESVYPVIEDILNEIIDLFPGTYIHIGGDEVDKEWWEACPHCQERMRKEGLEDMDELQAYFIKRLEKIINKRGRKLIGWDEILEGGLSETASVMGWRGMQGAIESVKQGRETVVASNLGYYIQKGQTTNPFHPQKWPMMITTEHIYGYNPIPEEISEKQSELILGIQTSLWTPFTHKDDLWDIATYPRNCALSEAAWTLAENKDWKDFQNRMKSHSRRMAYSGVSYWRENSNLIGTWETDDLWRKESTLSYDVTKFINQAGVYFFLGDIKEGAELVVERAILLKDGKQIASDKHWGYISGIRNHERLYFLDVQNYSEKAKYEIVFSVIGTLGEVSKGEVFVMEP